MVTISPAGVPRHAFAPILPSGGTPVLIGMEAESGCSIEVLRDRLRDLMVENQALRSELERAGRLRDHAGEYAVITMNLGGRITGSNTGAHAILGYGAEEMRGRCGDILFSSEDREAGAFIRGLCDAMEHGRAANESWHVRRDGGRFWASGSLLPLLDGGGTITGFLNVFRDGTEARSAEKHRTLLLAEMEHRIKNALATVQAIAVRTFRGAGVPHEVRESFSARLMALARSHELLTAGGGTGAPLADVVEGSLRPYGEPDRTAIQGPPVHLPVDLVETLGLAFHELATNAAKYGALSVPQGRVEVRWERRRAGEAELLDLLWREVGGPPVSQPTCRGFGSQMLERGLTGDIGGTVELSFHPHGLECRIGLPLRPVAGAEPE